MAAEHRIAGAPPACHCVHQPKEQMVHQVVTPEMAVFDLVASPQDGAGMSNVATSVGGFLIDSRLDPDKRGPVGVAGGRRRPPRPALACRVQQEDPPRRVIADGEIADQQERYLRVAAGLPGDSAGSEHRRVER